MELQELTPMLWTDDVKATIDYYVNILGFEEGNSIEEWQWGVVEKDKIKIMLAKPNEHTPYDKPQFTGSLYLRTNDVEAWWNHLKDKATIFYSIENLNMA